MKRFSLNFVLVIAFALLLAGIALPFIAEVEFGKAKKLEGNYRWEKAGEAYQQAVHLNPFNAEYFAEAGNFMERQSKYRDGKDKVCWLRRAEKLYQRACQLNPSYAEYNYLLGEAQLQLNELSNATKNFRAAINKDPFNFRNNYLIGYALFSAWKDLKDEDRKFALERFNFVLRTKSWYGEFVYPAIDFFTEDFKFAQRVAPKTLQAHKALYSFLTENNLWQYRASQQALVDFYREKEDFAQFSKERKSRREFYQILQFQQSLGENIGWLGKSDVGDNTYSDGNMLWSGTLYTVIKVPSGKSIIKIRARGEQAYGVWPYMIVKLNDMEIGETFVSSPDWQEYSFKAETNGGLKVLSVTFPNDGGDWEKGLDRNLYIGQATVTRQGIWWND